jgi:GNAT superfamily N-acetyltransferase
MEAVTIAEEIDSTGKTVVIKQIDKITYRPLYSFFLRQQAELIESGLSYPRTSWNDNSCGAIFAEEEGKIIGHIVYDTEKQPDALWITLSAVESSCRGRGIYHLMHKHFEVLAKEKGCWYIASHVHINNSTRLKSAEKEGMKPIFYFMAKKISS